MADLDLFAGPGGWDVGARALGLDPLGIEYDDAACATREAAGLRTLQADVAELEPGEFGPVERLIASPPCQARSSAGKRLGVHDVEITYDVMRALVDGRDTRAERLADCADERSMLMVEPLRWALVLRPRLLAFEQVPPVLADWQFVAELLRVEGYGVWTGILEAERYGVPQTRERAILLADRGGQPHPPAPTHQRYVPGEPARHDVTLAGEVRPWVSMAEALGWNGRVDDQGGEGSAIKLRANAQANAAVRGEGEPAPTITGGNDSGDRRWLRERPATTVAGDPRIARPGHHGSADERDPAGRSMTDAVRVTVAEASVLQGFPPDYPWQGSRTAQFQQIGDAVPPPLAEAILAALVGAEGLRP